MPDLLLIAHDLFSAKDSCCSHGTKDGVYRVDTFEYLDDMRDMGMDIQYSRRRRTYYTMSEEFDFMI